MNELFESLDINDDKKTQLTEAFDKAVLAKSVELMEDHVETKVNEAKVVLEEEFAEKVEVLEDTLDGYMTSVVEEFVAENAASYEAQISDEKAKKLLEMFDSMAKVVGVTMLDINESRSERDIREDENSLENKVSKLDKRLSEKEGELHESRKEADKYLKSGVIAETKLGLTMIEGEKFEKLAEMVTFSRDEKYITALDTVKDSIVESRADDFSVSDTLAESTLPTDSFKSGKVDVAAATDFSKYI